jgi:hypothetical protein
MTTTELRAKFNVTIYPIGNRFYFIDFRNGYNSAIFRTREDCELALKDYVYKKAA